uniref:DUF2428 domain-containing protein n=1 Tax=Parastrongyloides trichosuri TaxID=131310 RepID=A0A0N5A1H1_PARTI
MFTASSGLPILGETSNNLNECWKCKEYNAETPWSNIDEGLKITDNQLPTCLSFFHGKIILTTSNLTESLKEKILHFFVAWKELKSKGIKEISDDIKKSHLGDIKKLFIYLKLACKNYLSIHDIKSFKIIIEILLKYLRHIGDIIDCITSVKIYDNINENYKLHALFIIYSSTIEILSLPGDEMEEKIFIENGNIVISKLKTKLIEGYLIGIAWYSDKLVVSPLCSCFYNSLYQISYLNTINFWQKMDKTIQLISQCQISKDKKIDMCEEFIRSIYISNNDISPACFFMLLKVLHNFNESLYKGNNGSSTNDKQLHIPLRMIIRSVFPSLLQTRKDNLSRYLVSIYEILLTKPVTEYEYCDTLITHSIHALIPTFNESFVDSTLEDIFNTNNIYSLHDQMISFYNNTTVVNIKNQQPWSVFVKLILLISKNTNIWIKNESKILHLLNINRIRNITKVASKKLILLYFGILISLKSNVYRYIIDILNYDIQKCDEDEKMLRLRLFGILIVEVKSIQEYNTEIIDLFGKFSISNVNHLSMLPECIMIDKYLLQKCDIKCCLEKSLSSLTDIHRGNINIFLDVFNTYDNVILWENCWKSLIVYWSNPSQYFLDRVDSKLRYTIINQMELLAKEEPTKLSRYFQYILIKCVDKLTFKVVPKKDLIEFIELYLTLSVDLKICEENNLLNVWILILLTNYKNPKIDENKLQETSTKICTLLGNEFTSIDEFLDSPLIPSDSKASMYLINYIFTGIKSISDIDINFSKKLISSIISNNFCEIIQESIRKDSQTKDKNEFFIYFTVELFSNVTKLLIDIDAKITSINKAMITKCCQTFLERTITILKNEKYYDSRVLTDKILVPILLNLLKLNLEQMEYLKKLTMKIVKLGYNDEYFRNNKYQELINIFPLSSNLLVNAKSMVL